jgi:hypothetical protein
MERRQKKVDILVDSAAVALRKNSKKPGGNKKPQRFRRCDECDKIFGPIKRLSSVFCSQSCHYNKRKGQPKKPRSKPTVDARRATGLLAYYVKSGKIIKPDKCEECGAGNRKIDGAHFDYSKKLLVRWLCRSCHTKWDHAEPKGGTVIVERWQNLTGGKATRKTA